MKKGKDNNLDKDDMFEKSHLKLNTLNVQPLQCCYAAIFTDKKYFFVTYYMLFKKSIKNWIA
jgi:hypothetical protein